ncbi:CPBP family intramembrane glutamic endopeptidase [Flavobacterium sp. TSSA_36]|uniref:CPBP family intramembrane glutamic endopeptidase n=1 Tax=Flavobacterium sp. TSSA_36 TaxID=3447669 RepID=UPI003F2DF648
MGNYLGVDLEQPIVIVYSFLIPLLLLLFIGALSFKRPIFSLYAATKKALWKDFWIGVFFMWLLSALFIFALVPDHKVFYVGISDNFTHYAFLMLGTCIGYLIQTGCEELYFRGYFMQATYSVLPFFAVVIGIQAYVFGQLHAGNVAAWGNSFTSSIPYMLQAISFGWAAWRSGSLFLAWGLHFGNNSFLTFFVATRGDVVKSNALFAVDTPPLERTIIESFIVLVLLVVFLEIIYKNRYKERSLLTMLPKEDV